MKKDDLLGKRFGRLVVIGEYEPSSKSSNKKYATVLCRCDCGTEKPFDVANLQSGATKSCGCFRKEFSSEIGKKFGREGGLKRRKYSPVESSARDLFMKYKKRNPGNLVFEDFWKLTQLPCYYCGILPQQVYLSKNATDNEGGKYLYNGLDRIDNSQGYDRTNVVPCCGTCNFMRHKLSSAEFYAQIAKIVSNRQDIFLKLGIVVGERKNSAPKKVATRDKKYRFKKIAELLKFVSTLDDEEIIKATIESVIELLEEESDSNN